MLFSILENLIYYIFHLSLIISNKLLINILIIIKISQIFTYNYYWYFYYSFCSCWSCSYWSYSCWSCSCWSCSRCRNWFISFMYKYNIINISWRLIRSILIPIDIFYIFSDIITPFIIILFNLYKIKLNWKYGFIFLYNYNGKSGPHNISRFIPVPYPIHIRTQLHHNK
jgi:hypothetical protein